MCLQGYGFQMGNGTGLPEPGLIPELANLLRLSIDKLLRSNGAGGDRLFGSGAYDRTIPSAHVRTPRFRDRPVVGTPSSLSAQVYPMVFEARRSNASPYAPIG